MNVPTNPALDAILECTHKADWITGVCFVYTVRRLYRNNDCMQVVVYSFVTNPDLWNVDDGGDMVNEIELRGGNMHADSRVPPIIEKHGLKLSEEEIGLQDVALADVPDAVLKVIACLQEIDELKP